MPYPDVLKRLLHAASTEPPDVAQEAALVLRMFVERHCMIGDTRWKMDVENFLILQEILWPIAETKDIRNLEITEPQRNAFVRDVFSKLSSADYDLRSISYILKQSSAVPGIESKITSHIIENWATDEVVTVHLIDCIWGEAENARMTSTFQTMIKDAKTDVLRERAKSHLDMLRQLKEYSEEE